MKLEIPNSIEAEKSVIGSMFLSKYAQDRAFETLVRESFYLEKHGKIFEAIKNLYNKQVAIDLTTVTDELKNQKTLDEVGGVEYLTDILDETPTASNVDYYIKIVSDKSILRKLIDEANSIATLAYQSDLPLNDTLEEAEAKIFNVSKNRKVSDLKTMSEVLGEVQKNLEKKASNKGKISGTSTGLYDFDNIIDGFHESELIIIAARPAMGKSALGLNIATNVAKQKKSVIIFTLEMPADQLVNRMIASLGQVEAKKLQTGSLQNQDWIRVNEAMSQLQELNIYIDDSASVTISDIRAKSRRLASIDENLGLIIVDHLGLVNTTNKYGGNRQQEVADISRSLKALALELKIPIVALAQLSRGAAAREDKRPVLIDLRESGSIEQDADVVTFIHRDDYYSDEAKSVDNISKTELIVRKNRSGETGTAEVLFKKNTVTFLNYKNEEKEGNKDE